MKKQANEKEPVFLKEIATLESELKSVQSAYDSLNVLHTKEVAKLEAYSNK